MTTPAKTLGLQVVAEGIDNPKREVAFKKSAMKVERVTFYTTDVDLANADNDSQGRVDSKILRALHYSYYPNDCRASSILKSGCSDRVATQYRCLPQSSAPLNRPELENIKFVPRVDVSDNAEC